MLRWIAVALLAPIAVACKSTPQMVPPPDHGNLEHIQRAAAIAARDCAPRDGDTGRFIIHFEGLVDVATGGSTEQDELRVALVDATAPSDLPVKDSDRIAVHAPQLIYAASLDPSAPEGWVTESLQGKIVMIRSNTNVDDVWVDWQPIGSEPSDGDRCSLRWVVPIDGLVTNASLREGVFASQLHADVTALVTIGEGKVFTVDVFRYADGPCMVTLSDRPERAVASSFAVALPGPTLAFRIDDEVRELRVSPGEDAVITIRNHAVEQGDDYDFAGHFALRRNMHTTDVPLPMFNCPGITGNPQCSPANNQWP